MKTQAKREEVLQQDISPFLKFQLRTDKPEAERLELAGVRRIMIELEGKPRIGEFSHRYSNLVDTIADILKNDLEIKPQEEERFLTEIWGIMVSNLDMTYGSNKSGFISESLETAKWDCDNAAFLIFDVAQQLGVHAKIASVSEHAFIVTDTFFLEPGRKDRGKIYPISELETKHPIIYRITSDVEAIQSISYDNRGTFEYEKGLHDEAIADYTESIKLNPKNAQAYSNRGVAYSKKDLYNEAIADFTKSIGLDPEFAGVYYNRGNAYADQKLYDKAISDYTKTIELKPNHKKAYNNRGIAYAKQGLYEEAIADFKKAIEFDPKDTNARENLERAEKLKHLEKSNSLLLILG